MYGRNQLISFVMRLTNTARFGFSIPLNFPMLPLTNCHASSSVMQNATRSSNKFSKSLHELAHRRQLSINTKTKVPLREPSSAIHFSNDAGVGGSPGLGALND